MTPITNSLTDEWVCSVSNENNDHFRSILGPKEKGFTSRSFPIHRGALQCIAEPGNSQCGKDRRPGNVNRLIDQRQDREFRRINARQSFLRVFNRPYQLILFGRVIRYVIGHRPVGR